MDMFKKLDYYKGIATLLGGASGYYVARKKEYDRANTAIVVLMTAFFGAMLTDVIDAVRNKNQDRLHELIRDRKAAGTDLFTQNFISLILGGIAIFLLVKKDVVSKQQYVVIAIAYIALAFMVKEVISKKQSEDESQDTGEKSKWSLIDNKLDVEFVLFGIMVGVMIVYNRPNDSWIKYVIASLFGVGGGLVLSNLVQRRINAEKDELMSELHHLSESKTNAKKLLLHMAKSIDSEKDSNLASKIGTFVDGMNEKELAVMDKVYNVLEDDIDTGKNIDVEAVLVKLSENNFEARDNDSFLQVAEAYTKFTTGDFLPKSLIGKKKEFKATSEIPELKMDDDGFLIKTGKTLDEGDRIEGIERWLWVKTIVSGESIKKQLRVIDLDDGKYLMYVGVERI